MAATTTRVVIAEDLVLLREGLARLLTAEGIDVVAQVGNAPALAAAVARSRPDLAIVDVRMPPTFTDEGARVALDLRQHHPDVAILMLSHVVEPGLVTALAAAHPSRFGYLLKDRVLDVASFIDDVRRVAAGGTAIDAEVVGRLLDEAGDPRLVTLSGRERDVLALLAQGRSNAAIARRLVVSERTVDAHLRSIFVKLGLHASPDENRRVRAALAWLAHHHTA